MTPIRASTYCLLVLDLACIYADQVVCRRACHCSGGDNWAFRRRPRCRHHLADLPHQHRQDVRAVRQPLRRRGRYSLCRRRTAPASSASGDAPAGFSMPSGSTSSQDPRLSNPAGRLQDTRNINTPGIYIYIYGINYIYYILLVLMWWCSFARWRAKQKQSKCGIRQCSFVD